MIELVVTGHVINDSEDQMGDQYDNMQWMKMVACRHAYTTGGFADEESYDFFPQHSAGPED